MIESGVFIIDNRWLSKFMFWIVCWVCFSIRNVWNSHLKQRNKKSYGKTRKIHITWNWPDLFIKFVTTTTKKTMHYRSDPFGKKRSILSLFIDHNDDDDDDRHKKTRKFFWSKCKKFFFIPEKKLWFLSSV